VLSRVGESQPKGKQNGSVDSQCESRSQPAARAVRILAPRRMSICWMADRTTATRETVSAQSCWCGSANCTRVTFPNRLVAYPCRILVIGRGSHTNNLLASSPILSYTVRVTVCAATKPEALKLWFSSPRGTCAHTESQALRVFSLVLQDRRPKFAARQVGLRTQPRVTGRR